MKADDLPVLIEEKGHVERVVGETIPMSESGHEERQPGLSLNDILYMLFRHKWKIISCAMAGIAAAAGFYFLSPPVYESQAKLLVRYVVDRSAVDVLDSKEKTPGTPSEGVILSEAEILTSSDLATQVAEAVGVNRLAPRGTRADAAARISQGLKVTALKDTNIISVRYQDEDPKLAMQVLQELVNRYFDKHLEVHRSAGAFAIVARQTDQLRTELNQTDEQLKQLKAKAGITSLAESTTAIATELTKDQEDLDSSEAELASQQARVKEIERALTAVDTKQKQSDNSAPQPSNAQIEEYRSLISRVAQLRQTETELLSRYTEQNRSVKVKRAQIDDLEKQRHSLEEKFPGLVGTASATGSPESARPDLVSEKARLVEVRARTETLRSRLSDTKERAKLFSEFGPRIAELERAKEVQETNYKYYEASLEKARVDETLDPSRMPNISVVQKPEMGLRATRDVLKKIVLGLAGAGFAFGIAIALLIELVLDRTVKRSQELESRLQIPLLLSIPYFSSRSQRLQLHDAGHDSDLVARPNGNGDMVPLADGELLRPFCEAIRDRLGLFFEVNHMAHKPKLVAVTGLADNAGASTLAAGLANALSEGTEGKVILVDKPPATRRFYNMLMEFKTSDLDYVVFDMPSLGDTSATLPLACFMDTVLLVVEAEKSNRSAVKRAYQQLAAKSRVSVVFNKSRSYGPRWLEGEV
jgi:polysaccharide biosynthesis transport protein